MGSGLVASPELEEALRTVETWPVTTVAAGVSDQRGPVATHGPADRRLRWASITKLLTALAVLVAVEEETLDLDEPAGPPGSTVRHLLAHASGLPFDAGEPVTEPGRRRIYSNLGFEVLAETLADRAQMPFVEYLHDAVIGPLGLTETRLEGSPAVGAIGPLTDVLRLGRELLAPTLVARSTLDEAVTVAFPGLDGVLPGFGRQTPNDWGLGFELRDDKHPHWTGRRSSPTTFGHFGGGGGFLWVDPGVGLACASLSDREFGPWAAEAWPELADAVLASVEQQRCGGA